MHCNKLNNAKGVLQCKDSTFAASNGIGMKIQACRRTKNVYLSVIITCLLFYHKIRNSLLLRKH